MLRTVTFRITNAGLYYNSTEYIGWEKTNLPKASLTFSERIPIFWELTMLGYRADIAEQDERRQVKGRLRLEDTAFKDGGVAGLLEISPFPTPATFWIPNEYIVKEFNWIKPYFVRLLKCKKIEVSGFLVFADDGTIRIDQAKSTQLERIDHDFLQLLRIRRMKELMRHTQIPRERSLFTADEVVASKEDDHLVTTTQLSHEEDLLTEILSLNLARNARQLAYLAREVHQRDIPLRYTLLPQFGFVFLHRGRELNHFIWELIDSHATYVWSFPPEQSLENTYQRIESEISLITASGRMAYRQIPKEVLFETVIHDNAKSPLKDGFPRWKNKIENLLV